MNLWVPATNCCPIDECNMLCISPGYPTWIGILVLLFVVSIIGFTLICFNGKFKE